MIDIHTGWVEAIPIMGKNEIVITNGIKEIKKDLPFSLKGIDSDNSSEFINSSFIKANFIKKFNYFFTVS